MSDDCKVRLVWMKATEALYEILDSTTIEDVMQSSPDEITSASGNQENCRQEEGFAGSKLSQKAGPCLSKTCL
jgi:hypothetical protein